MNHDALIDRLSGSVETSRLGTIRYYNSNGELHRTDGPAVIYICGTKFWYINGIEVTKIEHARLAAEIQSQAS